MMGEHDHATMYEAHSKVADGMEQLRTQTVITTFKSVEVELAAKKSEQRTKRAEVV